MIPSFDKILSRALRQWQIWRDKRTGAANYRRLLKTNPELRCFDQAENDAIRKHKPVEHIRQAKKDYMTALLRQEGRARAAGIEVMEVE